jgi:hypothetical protein
MNNRIKMTDSKFKCNIFLFLSVTVFMARLSITIVSKPLVWCPGQSKRIKLSVSSMDVVKCD